MSSDLVMMGWSRRALLSSALAALATPGLGHALGAPSQIDVAELMHMKYFQIELVKKLV